MDSKYETSSLRVCFLNESFFIELHRTIVGAFADYVMPFEMTEEQFRNHIVLNAADRSRVKKRFVGAFIGPTCGGYIVFSTPVGRISQLAVDPAFRGQGIGTRLLKVMAAETDDCYQMQVINIDRRMETALTFFENRGFAEKLSQFEMKMTM